MTNPTQKPNQFFASLTGLRGITALMVFAHHYFAHHPKLPNVADMLVSKLFIGLTLFFVLTGFLIAHRYFPTARFSFPYLKKYYQNRFVRVYPLYFILTVITLIWLHTTDVTVWLVNLTVTKALFSEYKFTGLAQTWSLTVIELFYLFAPLLHLWVKSNRSVWWWLLPGYLAGAGLVFSSDLAGLGSFFSNLKFMLVFTVFGHLFPLFFGIWCMNKLPLAKQFTINKKGLLTYGSITGVIAAVYLWSFLAGQNRFFWPHEYGGILFTNVLTAVLFGGLILGLVLERTWVSRILSWRPVQEFGKSSYAFFLLNMGFFADLIYRYIAHNPFGVLLITGFGGWVLHQLVERPLLKRFGGGQAVKKFNTE